MIRKEVEQLQPCSGPASPKMKPLFPVFQFVIKEVRAELQSEPFENMSFLSDHIVFARISSAVKRSGINFGTFSREEMRYLARKTLLGLSSKKD